MGRIVQNIAASPPREYAHRHRRFLGHHVWAVFPRRRSHRARVPSHGLRVHAVERESVEHYDVAWLGFARRRVRVALRRLARERECKI